MKKPENIFLALTPLNILLFSGIALERGGGFDNRLFIVSDFECAHVLKGALETWGASPFSSIHLLPGVYGLRSLPSRILRLRLNARIIAQQLADASIRRVFLSNDRRPEGQMLLRISKIQPEPAQAVYVDEGVVTYQQRLLPYRRSLMARMARKILYGRWWVDTEVIGCTPWIDRNLVMFPDLVRPELNGRETGALDVAPMRSSEINKLSNLYAQSVGFDSSVLGEVDILLMLPHSSVPTNQQEYACLIQAVCDTARRTHLAVAVKYHPRESVDDFCSIERMPGCHVLPRALPVEVAFSMAPERVKKIVGDFSTALLTARWLLADADVVSIASLAGPVDRGLRRTFDSLHIRSLSTIGEVDQVFGLG